MSAAGLSLEGIDKAWEDGAVGLASLSLRVEPGELVAVLGPSGSGKSTALRVVAGLESPDAGVVRIGDRDVTAVEPSQRRVAMVFQSFALFPHLSAEDNIAFGLRARGASREEARARARAVAEPLALVDLLGRRPA
ncbi:MAG TPA: ATP-binding cassette domain-containing protein, partial [Solirubrobacteraceae bacterium]|nr:ATP-binding cassette domain-containing protein [Solirubrobacteraceae bacterium]